MENVYNFRVDPPMKYKKVESYFSNASWSKIGNTQDEHNLHSTSKTNLSNAKAICSLLIKNYNKYTPCEIRGVCLKAWVTDKSGKIVSNIISQS